MVIEVGLESQKNLSLNPAPDTYWLYDPTLRKLVNFSVPLGN